MTGKKLLVLTLPLLWGAPWARAHTMLPPLPADTAATWRHPGDAGCRPMERQVSAARIPFSPAGVPALDETNRDLIDLCPAGFECALDPRPVRHAGATGVVVIAVASTQRDSFVSLYPQAGSSRGDEWWARNPVPLPSAGLAGLVTLGGIVFARHRRMRS